MSEEEWTSVYEAWVDFNDIDKEGYTSTLRKFTHPELDVSDIGCIILVGDNDGNSAFAKLLSLDDLVRLRVFVETFDAG